MKGKVPYLSPSRVQIPPQWVPTLALPSPPIINSSTRQLAGNISRYLSYWKRITNSNFLLNIINLGYKIKLPIILYQSKPIVSVTFKSNFQIIEGQILDHLESGAISIYPFVEGQHICRVFTVKKSYGKDRLIIDLRPLNLIFFCGHQDTFLWLKKNKSQSMKKMPTSGYHGAMGCGPEGWRRAWRQGEAQQNPQRWRGGRMGGRRRRRWRGRRSRAGARRSNAMPQTPRSCCDLRSVAMVILDTNYAYFIQ